MFMDFEKYTDRAKGFVQSAQMLAMREGHPQMLPEHILKVLLEDNEGLCSGLIDRAGGNSKQALMLVEDALAKQSKVSGGAAQPQASRDFVRLFDTAQKIANKAGELRRHRRAYAARNRDREGYGRGQAPRESWRDATILECCHQ